MLELFMVVAGIAVLLLLVRRLIPPSWEALSGDLSYPELPEPSLLEALSLATVAAAIHLIAVILMLGGRCWLAWAGLGMYAVAVAALWIWAPIEALLFIGTWTTTLVLTLLAARARGMRLTIGRRATERVSDDPSATTRRERFVSLFENSAVLAVLAVGGLYVWLDHTSILTTYRFVLAGHAMQDDDGSVVGLDFEYVPVEEFSLAGVGSLHSLTELHLSATEITDSDLRHIQDATSLEELTLRFTDITDDGLRHLKKLTRLRELELSGTKISDAGLRHVQTLQGLEYLELEETQVTLAGACQLAQRLDSLREVDLQGFEWDDDEVRIQGECSHEELRLVGTLGRRHLWVDGGHLAQDAFAALPSLASVEAVLLHQTQSADGAVRHMKDMPALRELYLMGDGITDDVVTHATCLPHLKHLLIRKSEVTTDGFRHVSSLVNLISLNISGSNVTDDALRHVGTLTSLERLVLWDTAVQDLSPLETVPSLKSLEVSSAPVNDPSPLAKLMNLEHLVFQETSATDVSPVFSLTSLKSLKLTATSVKDLSPLANLTNLEHLVLLQTPATDLSPLSNLTKLKELHLGNTLATPKEVARLQKALPDCSINAY
ncbi:MAG: hypothetical protein H8E44_34790 [Planctomycetes bacterium]|nr:hypothetical protein [Planctomycetota bacterium]